MSEEGESEEGESESASWKGKEHRSAVSWRELYEKSVCVANSLIALGKPLF